MAAFFSASFTMFVYLKGHYLLESYFMLDDSRAAANDGDLSVACARMPCAVPEAVDYHGWD